ncbi:16140_t:CDS:2 [Gigaspora margarita]|uniref:16140_t:CDS:1 n=1 Tax=Gigaspora margarita TaxID=4874 RepID=A0ABN7VX09_GIGMA|nr:16140_t:CDS:2 [Gigaspora margarita]
MKTKQEICQRKNKDPSLSIDQLSAEYTKFEELENAMNIWMRRVLSQNGIITDGILQVQAKKFAELLGIPEDDFKASHGWLDRFKRRHEVRKFKIQGELESVPVKDLPEHRWKMMPDQMLASKPVKGKKIKDRITVLLCTNTTGTDKLEPLVIGKSPKPHCFKGVQRENLGVTYDASKKAEKNAKNSFIS